MTEDRNLSRLRRRRRRPARSNPAKPCRKRRGATAMEYVVVLSFVFVVVFAAVQNLGSMLGNSFQNSAQKVPSGK